MIALVLSIQMYMSMHDQGHAFVRILGWQLTCWNIWLLGAPSIVRRSRRSFATSTRRRLAGLVMLAALLVIPHNIIGAQLTVWLQPFGPVETSSFARVFVTQLPWVVAVDVVFYALLVIGVAVSAERRRTQMLAVRESQLQADLARAQLDALRLEIQPHFLFNTLNSIAALIRSRDNVGALEMLLGLSDLLRATIDRPAGAVATLDSEVRFLEQYVDLQRRRFGERLEVVFDIPDVCRPVELPNFLLQPLVENAFRHGVSKLVRPCRVEIGARLDPGRQLHIWVTDTGAGLPPGFELERDAGIGLRNTVARLRRIYGAEASLVVREHAAGGTAVELALPSQPRMLSVDGAA